MALLTVQLATEQGYAVGAQQAPGVGESGRSKVNDVLNIITAALSGKKQHRGLVVTVDDALTTPAAPAVAVIPCAGVTAGETATATVDGDSPNTISFTANAGSTTAARVADANTMAAGINAAAVASKKVRAFRRNVHTLTLASVTAGTGIVIDGREFRATSTATGQRREFSISGNDSADATALAAAIMADPDSTRDFVAVAVANAVHIIRWRDESYGSVPTATAATVTIATVTTSVIVVANVLGAVGNAISLSATQSNSNTAITIVSAGSGKLGGGLGGARLQKAL
ncbi:MAG: hypothetical protein SFW67_35570 [Myxococcaceae bacterium]|nr:hypothetical protein [Myxococcaceae bacterium]